MLCNFAFKELHYCIVCLSFSHNWRNCISAYHIGKWLFKKVTMFPILFYEHDYNIVCHKHFITTHLLVYKLGYCEAIILIIVGHHKAITLLLLHYQYINHYTWIYEFPFHIVLPFLMTVLVIHRLSTVFRVM